MPAGRRRAWNGYEEEDGDHGGWRRRVHVDAGAVRNLGDLSLAWSGSLFAKGRAPLR
jgi:hypothetical protein